MARHSKPELDIASRQFQEGVDTIRGMPLFYPLARAAYINREADSRLADPKAWAYVTIDGAICCHPTRRGTPEEWVYVIAHCLLHLGMGHFNRTDRRNQWNSACDCVVAKFLADLKLGRPPGQLPVDLPSGIRDERTVLARLEEADPRPYLQYGLMPPGCMDMVWEKRYRWMRTSDWQALFAQGLQDALRKTVDMAAGRVSGKTTKAERMKEWFVSSYPLLGAIASGFQLIEDTEVCQRLQISVAAIAPGLSEIYINPAAGLGSEELRFVMAHEFLHASLRHDARCQGRDDELWNVACDFVINGWLKEMRLGEMPSGCLYDEQFKELSAESVYDRIVTDLRRYRKLATLRGAGLGDIIASGGSWWERGGGMDLDGFYRSALAQGLEYHSSQQRGYLPAGLVEEIRALAHPPIPWDVELAEWFDEQFAPLEKVRTYARPSKRQSSVPDIPRPSWTFLESIREGRTYGVVLDTSGSMDRHLLAAALGAVASYSISRDVNAVRVVFCDAAAYDQGIMRPEDIAGSVRVRGRGGTMLQPGIDLLDADPDFPKQAPLLIITDGYCDRVQLRGREHAFLIPRGVNLPFVPHGKVFRMR